MEWQFGSEYICDFEVVRCGECFLYSGGMYMKTLEFQKVKDGEPYLFNAIKIN